MQKIGKCSYSLLLGGHCLYQDLEHWGSRESVWVREELKRKESLFGGYAFAFCSLSMNSKYSTLYSIGVCMDSGTGVSLSQPSTSGWKGLNDLHYKPFKKNHIYCRYHERFPDSKKSFVPMRPANWVQLNRFWKCLLYYQGASCKGLHWSIILWYIFTNRQQLEIVKKCPRATFLQKPKVFRQINLKYLLKYCQV